MMRAVRIVAAGALLILAMACQSSNPPAASGWLREDSFLLIGSNDQKLVGVFLQGTTVVGGFMGWVQVFGSVWPWTSVRALGDGTWAFDCFMGVPGKRLDQHWRLELDLKDLALSDRRADVGRRAECKVRHELGWLQFDGALWPVAGWLVREQSLDESR